MISVVMLCIESTKSVFLQQENDVFLRYFNGNQGEIYSGSNGEFVTEKRIIP